MISDGGVTDNTARSHAWTGSAGTSEAAMPQALALASSAHACIYTWATRGRARGSVRIKKFDVNHQTTSALSAGSLGTRLSTSRVDSLSDQRRRVQVESTYVRRVDRSSGNDPRAAAPYRPPPAPAGPGFNTAVTPRYR